MSSDGRVTSAGSTVVEVKKKHYSRLVSGVLGESGSESAGAPADSSAYQLAGICPPKSGRLDFGGQIPAGWN